MKRDPYDLSTPEPQKEPMNQFTVHKWLLDHHAEGLCLCMNLPESAVPIYVGLNPQDEVTLAMWCLVPVNPVRKAKMYIHVLGTGWVLPDGQFQHIGSVSRPSDATIWHIFRQHAPSLVDVLSDPGVAKQMGGAS